MICINCHAEGTKDKYSSEKYPICTNCVDEQIAKTKAEEMGKEIGVDWQTLRVARKEAVGQCLDS